MSAIHSKWARPETIIHKMLKSQGIKHVMHPKMKGRPDILLSNKKAVIFINGCFWHKCSKHFKPPSSNSKFWTNKIEKNVRRDRATYRRLRGEGWKVLVILEHSVLSEPSIAVRRLISSS